MSFPSKEKRQICYDSRDKLWECLDKNEEKMEACKKFRKIYEKNCSALWVKHFDRKRNYEKFKADLDASDWSFESEKTSEKPKT